jgi:hypothetical protein
MDLNVELPVNNKAAEETQQRGPLKGGGGKQHN